MRHQPDAKKDLLKPLLEEFRRDSLAAQLKEATEEIARKQDLIDSFCREILSAMQARDTAQALTAETLKIRDDAQKARDAAVLEKEELCRVRDDLSLRLESALKSQAERDEAAERAQDAAQDHEAAALQARLERDAAARELEALSRERDDLALRLEDERKSRLERNEAVEEERKQALSAAEDARRERDAAAREAETLRLERDGLRRQLDIERKAQTAADAAAAEVWTLAQAMASETLGIRREAQLDRDAALRAKEAFLRERADGERRLYAELEAERRARADAESRLEAFKAAAAAAEAVAAAAPPSDAPAPPSLAELYDPAWTKVLPNLRQSIAVAFARLKQLPLGAIPEGPRALIRLAAVSLNQTSDMLKALENLFDENAPPAEEGRIEATVESALGTWETSLRQRRILVSRQIDTGLPQVLFRGEALRTAIFQVVRNAYEAMPAGGTLTVRATRDGATGGITVRFSDTGRGFAPGKLNALFVPFTSARPGHLGMGLSLARRLVRRMGGEVEAGPAPSGGASVEIRLVPASAPPALS